MRCAAREEHLTVRGLRHRLLRWGPADRDPIVLLHGFMDSSETWQFVVDELPSDWSFVAFDWRGFGGTDRAAEGYWFPDYFADLEALLERLVPHTGARLVGHSMGGNIATLYAGIRPERIEWLVNLEGIGLPCTQPGQAPGRYAQWLDALARGPRAGRYVSVERFAETLRAKNPRWTPERARFIAQAWTRPRADGDGVELAADPRHRLPNPVLYRHEEAEACWRAVRAPVLLLMGEQSAFRPHFEERGGEGGWKRHLADLRFAWVAGAGHMMHIDQPAAVAAHIERFAKEPPDDQGRTHR